MIYPILWLFSASFKSHQELIHNPGSLLPHPVVLTNYADGWRGFGGTTFKTFIGNSLFVCTLSTVFQVSSSALVAYGFSRIVFRGRKLLFSLMIVTMLLPAQILLIPQYILMNGFGWINTYLPLLVPTLFGLPFFIFMIMQFIQGLPVELDEAAAIDGCNKYSTFFRILLPLLKPALITAVIFSFYWKWQEFLEPMLYLQNVKKYTMPIAMNLFSDPSSVTNWGAIYAMSIVSMIPVFLLFLFFQKYLVEGIATSGLKG
ncbi:MAG: carbohydrate ABC transporter permease [Provencibacterium sp.]|nr:carbohydrate ABC transporter permease [Provencibacterium sp.]